MKTYYFLMTIILISTMACSNDEIAIPQEKLNVRESKPVDPPPPPGPACELFETDHTLSGNIDDVDDDGQWFQITASGTVTSYLGTGSTVVNLLYNTKSDYLEGELTADFDSLYLWMTFTATISGPGTFTIDFPQVSGSVTTAGQVIYTMIAGSLEIELPALQEGSTSFGSATEGEYCKEDPGGVGCWAGNG